MSLPVGPRSHECAEKKLILLLKFACNTDVRPKTLVTRSINDNFVNKPKEQIMLAVLFWKIGENYVCDRRIMPKIVLAQSIKA